MLNPTGTATTIHVTDPTGANAYSGIGSFTIQGNAVEYVEKQATYTIYGEAAIKAVKVGFAAN